MRTPCLLAPLGLLLCVALAIPGGAREKAATKQPAASGTGEPIRVLLLTGGCCHDYEQQKMILSNGIQQRVNSEFTIVHEGGSGHKWQYEALKNDGWEDDYDAVLYNICFARETDVAYIESITAAHKAGLPAIALHCTMHSYHWNAKTDEWEKFLGVTSPNHGPHRPITVTRVAHNHPVMKGSPEVWKTPKGELYNMKKVWDTATVLANGSIDDGKSQKACVWVNEYGKGKVFGTTIGHHNVTMAENVYLDLVSRGLLWITDNLNEDGTPKDTAKP